jgi:hypothetical protein
VGVVVGVCVAVDVGVSIGLGVWVGVLVDVVEGVGVSIGLNVDVTVSINVAYGDLLGVAVAVLGGMLVEGSTSQPSGLFSVNVLVSFSPFCRRTVMLTSIVVLLPQLPDLLGL